MLSGSWESMIAETKLETEDQPRMLIKDPWELSVENSTSGL